MEHTNKYGKSKIKQEYELPLAGKGVINKLITDLEGSI